MLANFPSPMVVIPTWHRPRAATRTQGSASSARRCPASLAVPTASLAHCLRGHHRRCNPIPLAPFFASRSSSPSMVAPTPSSASSSSSSSCFSASMSKLEADWEEVCEQVSMYAAAAASKRGIHLPCLNGGRDLPLGPWSVTVDDVMAI
jgi:hypothetical protein